MWTCPQCGAIMDGEIGTCDECDFDESRNALDHPTLCPVVSMPIKYRTSMMITPNEAFVLATHYLNGNGVEKNEQYAVKLLRKAASANHKTAQLLLASCYEKGIGLRQNTERANWLKKQAETHNHHYFHKPDDVIFKEESARDTNMEDTGSPGLTPAPSEI